MMVTSDDMPKVIKGIKDGIDNATVVQGQYQWGYQGVQQMLNACQGIPAANPVMHLPCHVVDLSNVNKEYPDNN
jgi:ABC-type sugar transport system substrate-binding protein